MTLIFHNGPIFDGASLRHDHFAAFLDGRLNGLGPVADMPTEGERIDLQGDILSPGYVDLQVNGGGGLLLNDAPSVQTIRTIAAAHRDLGVTHLLPTLITDTREATRAAVEAAFHATADAVPGVVGLHLEGPHLAQSRKGAHDGDLIRRMDNADLSDLLEAATRLPCLKVTIAPENVTVGQVSALVEAGVLVSLGHTDAPFETCQRYFAAGARCATHLFNAMSQIGNRHPGLVGAVLANGGVSAGLIADGVHVHPEVMRLAWIAKRGPGRIFLVSDAMAVAGTDLPSFQLGGRVINRKDGQLRLEDGTLAGADLDLTTAVRVLVHDVGVPLEQALAAATTTPAGLTGLTYGLTGLVDVIRIAEDLSGATPVAGQPEVQT